MNHKYIQIKYFHDYSDKTTYKPERGRANFDEEVAYKDDTQQVFYVDTPYSILKRLEDYIRRHPLGGVPNITKILHS